MSFDLMAMKILFIGFCLVITTSSYAASFYQQLENKGLERYWLKLLHYEKNWLGHEISRVDGPLFFLHPDGKWNPALELEATLASFQDASARVGYFKQPPQCVFTERYRFLKKAGFVKTEALPCSDFKEWKEGLGAKAIVLIFSSSFPNNPASIFGHTFIRFNREQKNELLDYSASYAAYTEGETKGLVYAFKGLTGGYKGSFVISPYYMKVNEYTNSESRDLYEYELNLSQEGIEQILNHLWELYSTTYFDYYFLTENCSFMMSEVLELGNPDWNLSNVKRWYYLPSDAIKLAAKIPGAIRKVHFRPSFKKQLSEKLETLDAREQGIFFAVNKGDIDPQTLKDVNLLDALIAYWNFRKREAKGKLSEEDTLLFRRILLSRAQITEKSPVEPVVPYPKEGPEFGHEASRISVGMGNLNGSQILGIHFSSVLQDLLSDDLGFEKFSQIDLLGLGLEYHYEKNLMDILQIRFVNIVSLQPYTSFDPRVSWKLGVNYQKIYDLKCSDCYKFDVDAGMGGSFYLGISKALLSLIIGGFGEFSKDFETSCRLGPFVEWGLLDNPWRYYKIQLKQVLRYDTQKNFPKDYYISSFLGQALSWGKNWELRLQNHFISRYQSASINTTFHELQLGYYF
ncbi:DUF4105 domain-containing protein [Deltaproteobacteria bacterium TL4]